MTDKELIWCAALRYSLGRKTYMPSVIYDWFTTHKLSRNLIHVSIKDITDQEKWGGLGSDCDKKYWLKLKKYLQDKLE